jgi:hypothetical protein
LCVHVCISCVYVNIYVHICACDASGLLTWKVAESNERIAAGEWVDLATADQTKWPKHMRKSCFPPATGQLLVDVCVWKLRV